jgi:hypothetical protein
VHVFEHLDSSGTHRNIEVIKEIAVGPYQVPAESFQIILDNIEVRLDTFLSLRNFVLCGDMLVNSVHDIILMAGFLIKLNTEVQEHELKNILTILVSEILELFVEGLGGRR